jgi:prevent-host-death family protein
MYYVMLYYILYIEDRRIMKTINALTFRKQFGRTLDEVSKKKTPIAISRANKPLAVLVPFEDYESGVEQADRHNRLHEAASRIDEWRQKHGRRLKGLSSVEAIRQVRTER